MNFFAPEVQMGEQLFLKATLLVMLLYLHNKGNSLIPASECIKEPKCILGS